MCLSQRSEMKARLKNTPVITQPVINRGFSPCAPTSEMYLISVRTAFEGDTDVYVRDALARLHARVAREIVDGPSYYQGEKRREPHPRRYYGEDPV